MGFEFVEHGRQILTGEFAFKGLGDLLIVVLKIHIDAVQGPLAI
jgi:hypothetical protein